MPFQPYFFNDTPTAVEQIKKNSLENEKQSAEISALRTDVDGALNELNKNIATVVTDKLNEWSEDGSLRTIINTKKILIVGDSYAYGTGLASQSSAFPALISAAGFDCKAITSPGGGFLASGINGSFLDLINAYNDGDELNFTDILFVGGINDSYLSIASLHTAVETCINTARNKFLNATMHIGYISQTARITDGGCNYEQVMKTRQVYTEHSRGARCCYILNCDYMLKQIGVLQADGVHPNEQGHQLIANYLISYLLGQNINVVRYADGITLVYTEQAVSGAFNVEQTVINGIFNMTQKVNSVYAINNVGMTFDGNSSVVVGHMIGGLAYGQVNGFNQFGPVNFVVSGVVSYSTTENGDAISEAMPISIRMVGDTIFFAPMKLTNAATYTYGYIRQINLPPWSITISSDMI